MIKKIKDIQKKLEKIFHYLSIDLEVFMSCEQIKEIDLELP
jgi:hypothetical protein